MKRKSIGLKILSAGMTAILAFQSPVMSLQAAAASTQYISEVILSYGKTDDEAKSWLTQNGYKVVGQNLNEGGEGGTEALSWLGLASEKRSVFLGYKTTTNPEEAITDMKIMNMNGGYSYEAYEKVLADMAAEKEHFLQNITAALKEYRENYKKGAIKAKIAHDNLNKFKDDDSGALMGDLLLNTLKTEDEAAWEADKTQHADMVTILMQGNSTCVSEIMQNLAFAADTAEDSFVSRAIAAAGSSEKSPFDTFFDAYANKHPDYTKDEVAADLLRLYDDDAKMFASSLIGLRNYLSNYTQSELTMDADAEEADAYFAAHEFEDPTAWAGAANTYSVLSNVFCGDASLAAYLVYTDDDYTSDSALLSGYDALGLPQRAKLYPFIAQMSAGQRSLLEYTAMDRLLTMGLMDAETWQSTYATVQDAAFGAKDLEVCSVYAEVNRDDFKVGEIAVTNVAQGKQASTGEQIDEGLFGAGVSYTTAGLFIGGIVTTVAGVALAAKNWNTSSVVSGLGKSAALQDAIRSGRSMYTGMQGMANGNMAATVMASPQNIAEMITEQNKLYHQLVDDLKTMASKGKSMDVFYKQFLDIKVQSRSRILTFAGPNGNASYNAGLKVNYDDKGNFISLTSHDGTVITADGTLKIDMNVRSQYNRTMRQINPDLKAAEDQADDMLNNAVNSAQGGAVQHADQIAEKAARDWVDMKETLFIIDSDKPFFKEFQQSIGNDTLDFDSMTKEDFDRFADYMEQHHKDSLSYQKIKACQEGNTKSILDAKKTQENAKQVSDKADDIAAAGKEGADQVDDAAEAAMTSGSGSTFWKWFGVGMAIVGLIMSAYSVYAAISEMKAYYHQEMLPIPRKMIDLGYLEDGSTCYVYYDCAKCNRTAMNMGNETLGDYGDMNGDVMKQWLALYTTKDTRAGKPILANITVKKGTTSIPMKTVPLSFFGFNSAVNMTDTRFTYNNAKNGIYLYYKQAAASYTGTVATGSLYVTVGVLSAIGGAGICGILVALLGKRRKKDEQPTETKAA